MQEVYVTFLSQEVSFPRSKAHFLSLDFPHPFYPNLCSNTGPTCRRDTQAPPWQTILPERLLPTDLKTQ